MIIGGVQSREAEKGLQDNSRLEEIRVKQKYPMVNAIRYALDKCDYLDADILAFQHNIGNKLTTDVAIDYLYNLLRDCCKKRLRPYYDVYMSFSLSERQIGPIDFREIDRALAYLQNKNFQNVVWLFEAWNEKVIPQIYNNPDFKELLYLASDEEDYLQSVVDFVREQTLKILDKQTGEHFLSRI